MSLGMPYYIVYASIGGYGNHVRWLLLLDERFSITIKSENNLAGMDGQTLTTATEKTEFIKQHVYSLERTWNTWLAFEWEYRSMLDDYMKFTHDGELLLRSSDFFGECKLLAITCDPELTYRSYVKINPGLNGLSKEHFVLQNYKQNQLCEWAGQVLPLVDTIDSTNLFHTVLDKELYSSMLDHFNIQNHYEQAQEIHSAWYDCHMRAEADYVKST